MSSFKRRTPSSQPLPPLGTRPNAATPSIRETSTGVPSLDDILGGGIPLGSVLILLAPDRHSAWGELLQRYYIAQGLASGQGVCVVGGEARALVEGCMWERGEDRSGPTAISEDEKDADKNADVDEQVKIAWRYEGMKRFQTTVASSSNSDYSNLFDLTQKVPDGLIDEAVRGGQLTLEAIGSAESGGAFKQALNKIRALATQAAPIEGTPPTRQRVLRVSVPDLGGPSWGDSTPQDVLRFLYIVRSLVQSTTLTVLITLPPHLSQSSPSFDDGAFVEGWVQKLGFLSDACISLSSFGADESLVSSFPNYHGFVHVHRAPSIQSLVPPSHKLSVLRGLSSPSSHAGGGGENNLGFRCSRKRFVIETLHLDVEGGIGERRTAPPVSAHGHDHQHRDTKSQSVAAAMVSIEVPSSMIFPEPERAAMSRKKPKKAVAFQPDVYDF